MKVLILSGSHSDKPTLKPIFDVFSEFGINYEYRVSSAHRTPDVTKKLVESAESNGFKLIIAAAGMAAHLPGVCAAFTTLPVIGVPIVAKYLDGIDALYSIVQMPPGIPVASMAIGEAGAKNAALYAIQIFSLENSNLKKKLIAFREKQKNKVIQADLDHSEKG